MTHQSLSQDIAIKAFPLSLASEGQVTLPPEVLVKLQSGSANALLLVQIGELMMLLPNQPQVSTLANHFQALMSAGQVSLESLLEGLQAERQATWEVSQLHD